jgi:hypothetical protein
VRTRQRLHRIGAAVAAGLLAGCGLLPASPTPTAPPVGPGPVEELIASNIDWQPKRMDLPADVPATVVVDNRDPGIPHGLEIRRMDDGRVLFRGAPVVGPAVTRYVLPALVSDAYVFVCPVHANMTGELFVRSG